MVLQPHIFFGEKDLALRGGGARAGVVQDR